MPGEYKPVYRAGMHLGNMQSGQNTLPDMLCMVCRPLLKDGEDDVAFCKRLTVEAGVTALPVCPSCNLPSLLIDLSISITSGAPLLGRLIVYKQPYLHT